MLLQNESCDFLTEGIGNLISRASFILWQKVIDGTDSTEQISKVLKLLLFISSSSIQYVKDQLYKFLPKDKHDSFNELWSNFESNLSIAIEEENRTFSSKIDTIKSYIQSSGLRISLEIPDEY